MQQERETHLQKFETKSAQLIPYEMSLQFCRTRIT